MILELPYRNYQNPLRLQIGDVILCRNEFAWGDAMSYLSAAVRWWTDCYVNHTKVVSIDENGEWVLVEAVAKGLVARPLREHLDVKGCTIVHRHDPRPFDREAFAERLRGKVGCHYDRRNLILEQPPYRAQVKVAKALHQWSGGHVQFTPWWIGQTGAAAAVRLQCAETWAWAREENNFWIYSSKEILEHPHLTTEFFEMK